VYEGEAEYKKSAENKSRGAELAGFSNQGLAHEY
jgi:hypothetical protein